jgi:small subunit ribosomal protein S4
MIRKHKKYSRPRKPYDLVRFGEENKLIETYGLKNKREIWKADAAVSEIRRKAKALITADVEKSKKLIEKLNKQGFNVKNIADVLALNKEEYLKRRLQSILVSKGVVKSPKQARQLITHKHVLINKNIVTSPSYVVSFDEEKKIELKIKEQKKKDMKAEKKEEKPAEEVKEAEKTGEENQEGVKNE